MQSLVILERIKSFVGCGELSPDERKELAVLRKEIKQPIKLFQGYTMKPFTCSFCHKPTLQVCRDTRQPNTDNLNLIACCKSCKDSENAKGNPYLVVSSIFKQVN